MQGLIIENVSNIYIVKTKEGIFECYARGKLKNEEIVPVVGDEVNIEITNKEINKAIIEKILERRVYIKRPRLSNITQIVLVISSENPKPDLLMLDKQLAFSEYLGIKSLIVLNKIDLDKKQEFKNIQKIYKKIGYKVIKTEAKSFEGISELVKELNDNINAFSGNSGVGKSTLINAIFKNNIAKEGEISIKNKKGKNTTTGVKLYEINDDTYIADTPGFSTFDIKEIKFNNLEKYFIEFNEYIKQCEFVGCTHIKEKICGIKNAVEEGHINKNRYEKFCKIYKELKESEDRRW